MDLLLVASLQLGLLFWFRIILVNKWFIFAQWYRRWGFKRTHKSWFGDYSGKIPENPGKIHGNLGKIGKNFCKIAEDLGKMTPNVAWFEKLALNVCRIAWRPIFGAHPKRRSAWEKVRTKVTQFFRTSLGKFGQKSCVPPKICLLLHLRIHPWRMSISVSAHSIFYTCFGLTSWSVAWCHDVHCVLRITND